MADEIVSIRIRLSGGTEAAREAKAVGTEVKGVGVAATEASLASSRGARGISTVLGKLRSGWSAVKRVAKLGALGLVAGGIAAVAYGRKASQTTEDLAKATSGLHNNMGFSYEKASALLSLFKVRGAEPTKVALGFKALATQLRSAATGSESSIGYFRKLGFSQDDIQKGLLNSGFALNKVSKGFEKLPPSLQKSALGAKVFGKAYEAMFPLLRDGPKVLNEQIAKAKEYGAVLDGHAVTSTMGMVEAQREMQLASIGWQITFATKIEPTIVKVATAIAHFTNEMRTGTGAGGKFAAIMRVTGDVLAFTYNAIKAAVEWTVTASKATAAWSAAAGRAVAGGFRAFLDWITTTWRNVTGFVGDLLPVKAALLGLGIAFKVVSTVVSRFAHFVGPILGFWLGIASVAVTNLWKTIRFLATIISDVIGVVSNLLRGKWGAAWRSAKGMVGDVVNGIREALTGMLSFLGSLPGRVAGAMKGVGKAIAAPFLWAWKKISWVLDKLSGAKGRLQDAVPGFSLPDVTPGFDIPGFADGVRNFRGGLAVVGERGPELAFLQPGTNLIPNRESTRLLRARPGAGRSGGRSRSHEDPGRTLPRKSFERRSDGRTRHMQPIVVQAGRRTLLETIVETEEDEKARD